jgi:flagellar motor switch protein FliM
MTNLESTATLSDENSLPITPDAPIASPFRFSAASSLSPSRQESLGAWHRNFLRAAASSLTDLLRLPIELELDAIQVQTYGQLLTERGEDNQGLLFRMQPQPGVWLMDMPVSLSLFLVERMMGGSAVLAADKTRDLTDVEQIIFQEFAETLLSDYARSWRPHAELKHEIVRPVREIKQTRNIGHQSDDLLLRVGVRVSLKDSKSTLWIVIPIASIEDLLVRSSDSEESAKEDAPAIFAGKNSPMGSVPVPVSIRWQGFQMTLRDIESLAAGDLLILDTKKCENAVVWLGGRAKFSGRLVRESQKTTLTITEPLV